MSTQAASAVALRRTMGVGMGGGNSGGRGVGKIAPHQAILLLCDMQERFRPLIYHSETVVQTCRYMTSVASALNIPIIVTEHYKKVFGATLRDCFSVSSHSNSNPSTSTSTSTLLDVLPKNVVQPIFEKKLFSMLTDEVKAKLAEDEALQKRNAFIIVGIEAHVCVLQTCLDLLEAGAGAGDGPNNEHDYDVHVIVDGVSSQQALDRHVALQRLSQAGAFLTTAQSCAFMLMQSAEHPNFKEVSQLTVAHMKLPNAFNEDLLLRHNNNHS